MPTMTVRLDASEVHDLARDIGRHVEEFPGRAQLAVEKTGFDMQKHAQAIVPVDTGFLMGSINIDFGALSFDLGPTADYGDVIERGVPHPFVITAKAGGMLHFVIDGKDIFAKSVTHPPIAPRPYLGPAFDAGLPDLEDALGQLGEQVVRSV